MNNPEEEYFHIGERYGYAAMLSDFSLRTTDCRQPIYCLGKSGTGKTTFQQNLIIQHINNGHGVGVIDPHGDMAEAILDQIPIERHHDVIYFNPADREYPIAFNPFANVPRESRDMVTDEIMGCFKSIWHASWSESRMQNIFLHTIRALLDCPNATILGIDRMLIDPAYRHHVLKYVKNEQVKQYWEQIYNRYSSRDMREAIAPVQHRIGQLLMSEPIRNILGQAKNRLDFRHIMDSKKIFIANLAKGKIGAEKANLLGSLIVSQLQSKALSRANTPEHQRQDFTLFVDEFQSLVTDSFTTILSEARKYRLGLVLSHQFTAQLTPELQSAVFGNAGTIISFRIGNADAEVLGREMGEFSTHQFTELERYHAYMKAVDRAGDVVAFRVKMATPINQYHGRRASMIRNSRKKYAKRRVVVEEKLRRWSRLGK